MKFKRWGISPPRLSFKKNEMGSRREVSYLATSVLQLVTSVLATSVLRSTKKGVGADSTTRHIGLRATKKVILGPSTRDEEGREIKEAAHGGKERRGRFARAGEGASSHEIAMPSVRDPRKYAPRRPEDAKFPNLPSPFANLSENLFFVILAKIQGCKMLLSNCWSCSYEDESILFFYV